MITIGKMATEEPVLKLITGQKDLVRMILEVKHGSLPDTSKMNLIDSLYLSYLVLAEETKTLLEEIHANHVPVPPKDLFETGVVANTKTNVEPTEPVKPVEKNSVPKPLTITIPANDQDFVNLDFTRACDMKVNVEEKTEEVTLKTEENPAVEMKVERIGEALSALDKSLELIQASTDGNYDIVMTQLMNGVDYESMTTALVEASKQGHLKIVKILVQKGADVKIHDNEPLRVASKHGHLEIVKFLIDNGADVSANNYEAFRLALDHKHYHVVEFLTPLINFQEK